MFVAILKLFALLLDPAATLFFFALIFNAGHKGKVGQKWAQTMRIDKLYITASFLF
jgi:hypothetical protein